jgi:DNA mismatch endonuclease (patch repair protein)
LRPKMSWGQERDCTMILATRATRLVVAMTDTLSPDQRSERMSLVRGKNTKPELMVRRIIRSMGFRCSLHAKDLPGHPDFVLRRARKAIFVHGCFWHRHPSARCRLARLPKSRLDFWLPKLESNRLRDQRVQRALRVKGWRILIVWECQLSHKEQLENRLRRFLEGENASNRAIRGRGGPRAGN